MGQELCYSPCMSLLLAIKAENIFFSVTFSFKTLLCVGSLKTRNELNSNKIFDFCQNAISNVCRECDAKSFYY